MPVEAAKIKNWIDGNLHRLDEPAVYLGDEIGTHHRPWDETTFRVVVAGGTSYQGLAGNLAVPTLYQLINSLHDDWLCERAYFPISKSDLGKMEKAGLPIFTLEGKNDISKFDAIMFSGSYCGTDINILKMMLMSGIPGYSKDRTDDHPITVRGGAHSFSPAPFADMYDILTCGDGEDIIPIILEHVAEGKRQGLPRDEILATLTQKDARAFVPKFYEEVYDPESKLLIGWKRLRTDVPFFMKRAFIKDLDDGYILTEPVVSYIDPAMSAGTLLVSRGCASGCMFCQEGYTWRPYRELGVESAVDSLGAIMKNSGAEDVLPSAFCSSTYSQKKQLIVKTLETHSDQMSFISQRVDEMAEDPNFIELTTFAGNNTCSLGVEGNSQRMRDLLAKGCPEEDILRACEVMMRAGYRKIKFFMIANIPGEKQEDVEEVAQLAAKVQVLKEQLNSKCEIMFSWTPLVIESWTPLQFASPTLERRSLHAVLPKLKEIGVGFRIGSGGRYDESYLAEMLHLGDRRAFRYIYKLVTEHDFVHYGATPKGTKDKIESWMKQDGINWDVWFYEKTIEDVLSWDFMDIGISKTWLWYNYSVFRRGINPEIFKCIDGCDKCGACDTADLRKMASYKKTPDPETNPATIKVVKQKGTVQKGRFRFRTDEYHRFMTPDYLRMVFRRAAYMSGLPLDKHSVDIASANIKFRNWICGTDYVDLRFTEKLTDMEDVIGQLNEYISDWSPINKGEFKAATSPVLRVSDEHFSLFSMEVRKDIVEIEEALARTLNAEQFIITMKKSGGARGVMIREDVDVRPLIDDLWLIKDGHKLILKMLIAGRLSPYDLYQNIFNMNWSVASEFPAVREEIFLPFDGDQFDLFRPTCIETGKVIPVNLFDEPYHDDYHPRTLDQIEGKLITFKGVYV